MSDFNDGSGRAGGNGETDAPDIRRCSGGSEHGAKDALAPCVVGPLFRPECLGAYPEGYELIPLHGPEDRDMRGRLIGKAPIGRGWRSAPGLSLEEARAHMAAGQNVGVRLRDTDLVVDVDPRNFEPGDDPLARLGADLRVDLTGFPTVITGSGGKHIYMRKPEDAVLRDTLEAYQGVEFKSIGRQVVAAGSVHPTAKRPYLWDDDPLAVPLSAAAMAPPSLMDLARRPEPIATVGAGDRSPEELVVMLDGLDPTAYQDHQAWLELMMACHHATAGEGRDEWIEWSTSDPQFATQAGIIGRRWDSLHADQSGRRITEKTLFKALVTAGRQDLLPRTAAEDDFAEDLEMAPDEGGGDMASSIVEAMNKNYCAVLDGGQFTIFKEDTDDLYEPPRPVWTRMTKSSFCQFYHNERVTLPDRKRSSSKAEIWLDSPKMRKYEGIVMDPDGRDTKKLNIWKGWSVQPVAGDWSLMEELIADVLCSGDAASEQFVRRWIAFMLQHPGIRPEVAIAFRGNEGTGKGTLGQSLMHIAGSHGLTVSTTDQFAGKFNAHLRNVAFLFADEVDWRKDRAAEGVLKQLVTEPVISYEAKGKDIVPGRNLVHLMMASNKRLVVPAGIDARRFAVFDVSEKRRQDRPFFGRLKKQMAAGGLEAMVHDLMTLDLGDWHPAQNIPKTNALADQKLQNLDAATRYWAHLLEKGELPGVTAAEWSSGALTISDGRDAIRDDFGYFLASIRRHDVQPTAKALVAAGQALGVKAVKVNRNAERGWLIPKHADAVANFERRIGGQGLFD